MSQIYFDFLTEQLGKVQAAFTAFVRVLSLDDFQKKADAATTLNNKLIALKEALAVAHYPEWLEPLMIKLERYRRDVRSEDASENIILAITKYYKGVMSQKWEATLDGAETVQFVAIADSIYVNSKMPSLFDRLANLLEQLINEEKIDTVDSVKRLQELIKLIRANARTSFYSAGYIFSLSKKVICKTFSKVVADKAGPVFEAIAESIEEMSEEWPTIRQQLAAETTTRLESAMPRNKDLLALPDISEKEVIDAIRVVPAIEDKSRSA